jgi:hypothetical protein
VVWDMGQQNWFHLFSLTEILMQNSIWTCCKTHHDVPAKRGWRISGYFQQDGAPFHFGFCMRRWLDLQFQGSWIGHRGPVEWPPRSLDLSPFDFYLWGYLKAMVYQKNIQNMNYLNGRIRNAISGIRPEELEFSTNGRIASVCVFKVMAII